MERRAVGSGDHKGWVTRHRTSVWTDRAKAAVAPLWRGASKHLGALGNISALRKLKALTGVLIRPQQTAGTTSTRRRARIVTAAVGALGLVAAVTVASQPALAACSGNAIVCENQ